MYDFARSRTAYMWKVTRYLDPSARVVSGSVWHALSRIPCPTLGGLLGRAINTSSFRVNTSSFRVGPLPDSAPTSAGRDNADLVFIVGLRNCRRTPRISSSLKLLLRLPDRGARANGQPKSSGVHSSPARF